MHSPTISKKVSKTAPTGEYLSTGSFMIYGKKNYLAPATLEMGFGVLFRLEDGSVSRHLDDRVDRSAGQDSSALKYSEDSGEKLGGGVDKMCPAASPGRWMQSVS